mgnify:CR=1 FL=1|tara:strand:+ start:579 stop:875 length:297 start_codon:yes stop_codon:yes gene_type:complete
MSKKATEQMVRELTDNYDEPVDGNWLCTTWHLSGKENEGLYLTKIGELFNKDAWSLVLVGDDDVPTLLQFFPSTKKLERFLDGMKEGMVPYRFGRILK